MSNETRASLPSDVRRETEDCYARAIWSGYERFDEKVQGLKNDDPKHPTEES